MNAAPFLSICILTFNRKQTLEAALASIVPQVEAVDGVEVIVSDNVSQDGTDHFMREYVISHPKVHYFRNESNGGFDGNVQKSLERARGEYVAFFSDDDIAPPEYFSLIAERLRSKKPLILYVNHKPLTQHAEHHEIRGLSPEYYKEYSDGAEYITSCGLGFISSLILRRQEALPFLEEVSLGLGCAHQDIAYHVALSHTGPFIYDGHMACLAGRDETGGCILIPGCVNLAKLYKRLVKKNLIQEAVGDRWIGRQLMLTVPQHVAHTRARKLGEYPLKNMMMLYGKYWQFYLFVFPLYCIPHRIYRYAYLLRKAILSRKSRAS
jgi:glycosyltransferase involved in cell wall biosynthesis